MKKEKHDVVIVGAGPAGLSLASVLSQKNRVCVIERGKIGSTTKSWASARDLMKKLGLSHCIENSRINLLEFRHYLGAKWIFKDIYCQLNEEKLLKEFIKRCKKKNTAFLEKTEFTGFSRKKGRVIARAGKREIEARLIVDCSGAESPIIKKYRLMDDYSAYPILGYTVENVKVDPKKFIWEVMKTPGYHEIMVAGIMPYSDKKAQVHVFPYLKNKMQKTSSLKKYLKEYFTYYPGLKGAKTVCRTEGTIVMGDLKKNALDNVFFFGEAAAWTPRFTGAGMNQILRDYKKVGKELNKLIREGRLSEDVLSEIKPVSQEKRMVHLLRCFENIVLSMSGDPKRLNDFLVVLGESKQSFGKYLMRNEYNARVIRDTWKRIHSHFTILELLGMLPKKDVLYLLELGAELVEDSILAKYRKHLKDI